MRNLYIAVAAIFVLSVALFVSTFFYLDSSKHDSFEYTVSLYGKDIGTLRIDKFVTEDRLVYKCQADLPMAPFFNQYSSRLDLDRKYGLRSYYKEYVYGRATDFIVLEQSNAFISFLAKRRSAFTYVDNIPAKRGTFVFEEDSPVTYLPILESYDFSKGRSQVFYGITCPEVPDTPMPYIAALPPISRFVTFTSIKDEYLKIGQRKIKTENLILKIRNYPQGSVWVAKSDRALIKIELPSRGITFTRSFKSASITCEASSLQDPRYLTRDLSIKSAGAELAGRLTVPTNGSRFPAVLLIGGSYPGSADCGGLFEKIADLLSKDGYMVLRFDRRGIGLSKGESSSVTLNDDESDDAAALAHLKQLPSVDPDRIFMIGHAEGALSAMKLSSSDPQVKGVILLAAAAPPGRGPGNAAEGIGRIAAKAGWPDEYIELVKRAVRSTRDIADDANGDWGTVLGRKVFVRSAREEPPDIRSIASNLKAPVLILQGRKALELSPESSGELEQVFISAGNQKHTLKYYPDLGYFFGSVINDGIHKIRYETDGMVLRDIKEWLDRRLAENPPGEVVRATDNHVKPAFPAMRDSEPKRSEAAGPAG